MLTSVCWNSPCGLSFPDWKPMHVSEESHQRGHTECFPKELCMRLWKWNKNCSWFPRKMENPGMWRKAKVRIEQIYPKGEAMKLTTISNIIWAEAAQVFGFHVLLQLTQGAKQTAIRFNVCPARFQSWFGLIDLYVLFPTFGMEMFILCHCMWTKFNFLFDFHRGS